MKRKVTAAVPAYIAILLLFIAVAHWGSNVITALSEQTPLTERACVVIDAGHGGEDGGAVSCTGIHESILNLQIALKLNDLLHLLGIDTYMIRTTDRSVYTEGNSVAARKVSDLKERVRLINILQPELLVSIHQNHFTDSKYSGPQVFYSNNGKSNSVAADMQQKLSSVLMPSNNRKEKIASGIYLMDHIHCTGLLIECGFLSNAEEEKRLRDAQYQKMLAATIAAVVAEHLSLDPQTNE